MTGNSETNLELLEFFLDFLKFAPTSHLFKGLDTPD